MKTKTKCYIIRFEDCSLFDSPYAYAENYKRVICSCGWVSAPARGEIMPVLVWQTHVLSQ